MLAWCEVAEEVNKEALTQVNEWVLDLFVRGQVEMNVKVSEMDFKP